MVDPEFSPPIPFMETFETAASIALERPNTLWCRVERGHGEEGDSYSAPPLDVRFYELVSIEDSAGGFHQPTSSVSYDMSGTYHWRKWTAVQGRDNADTITTFIAVDKVENAYYRWPPAIHGELKEASMPRLADIFSKFVTNGHELEVVADRLVDWLEVTDTVNAREKSALIIAVQDIVVRGFAFIDYSQAGGIANNFLRAADTPLGREVVKRINTALGRALIQDAVGSYPKEAMRYVDRAAIVHAIKEYDQLGLLEDRFWIDFGVHAGGAVINSDFLPVLHAKLTGEDGSRLLQGDYHAQPTIRAYITSLLTHYQDDPARHGTNITAILQATGPAGRPQSNVDLARLVQLANGLTQRLNLVQHAETPQENLLAALNPSDMLSVSDALLRILYLTRRADLPHHIRMLQFEQDMLHAEVVSLIREGVRHKHALVLGHAALTFPTASPRQMQRLQQLLEAGTPLAEAIVVLQQEDRG